MFIKIALYYVAVQTNFFDTLAFNLHCCFITLKTHWFAGGCGLIAVECFKLVSYGFCSKKRQIVDDDYSSS